MFDSLSNLFHRRKQEAKGEIPTTYSYELTLSFKKRFIILLQQYCSEYDVLFPQSPDYIIVIDLRLAFGVLKLDELSNKKSNNYFEELQFFILYGKVDMVISAIEYICRCFYHYNYKFVDSTNDYFKYDRIGYKFISEGDGFIVTIEENKFHEECTVKSLGILSSKGYIDSQNYLISAYKKLATNDYDDALVDIGRSVETLLKKRFSDLGIQYDDQKDTLNKLLIIARAHINTSFSFEPFQQVILEIGRARNKMGAHGITPGQSPIADEIHVRFAINQATANLLFLAEIPMIP